VNFPARLVIIKNTTTFANNCWTELTETDLLQMIGRAGRPQFDDTGVAVILTRSEKRSKYENIVAGKEPLESRLPDQLAEHFNAEIGLGTIFDLDSAISWLKSTFLYVRCLSNPSICGKGSELESVDEWVRTRCIETIRSLQDMGLVETSPDGKLQNTAYGQAASRLYVRLSSVANIVTMKYQAGLEVVVALSLGQTNKNSSRPFAKRRNSVSIVSKTGRRHFTVMLSIETEQSDSHSKQGIQKPTQSKEHGRKYLL
jgi:ATP-dependent DNA helicase HFM1/MER3